MVVELDNYVLGNFVKGDKEKIIRDVYQKDSLKIYNVSSSNLRRIKREFPRLQDELSKIPIGEVIEIIKRAILHYYEDERKLELCSKVTGSPVWFLKEAVSEIKDWVANIEDYLKLSLGGYDYERIPIIYEGEEIAYQTFISNSPLIAILPRNSELESAYVIIQSLLARTPMIIKGPNQQGSIYSSIEFINSLKKVVKEDNKVILESINIVNIIEDEKSEIIERLSYDNATYMVFGSNETIRKVEEQLKSHNPRKIIKLGTGFSVSVVFDDYDMNNAISQICDSASIDRGNDCISTNIVYAHSSIKEKFIQKLKLEAEKYESGDPSSDSKIGSIHSDDIKIIHSRTSHLNDTCRGHPHNVHLSVFSLEQNHHFEEYPGPVLGVRNFDSNIELKELFLHDLSHNGILKNLVTSVFTKEKNNLRWVVKNFPSHAFKHNRGSHRMNFLLEHQGLYLIREILERKIVEVEDR